MNDELVFVDEFVSGIGVPTFFPCVFPAKQAAIPV
jgi:hypothetical protein